MEEKKREGTNERICEVKKKYKYFTKRKDGKEIKNDEQMFEWKDEKVTI